MFRFGKAPAKMIVGLGNVGREYDGTRHNIGFYCLDSFAEAHGAHWQHKTRLHAQIAEVQINGQKIILVKPTTFYNESGVAAAAIKQFYKLDTILVVHDELALPFGKIRTRVGGSDAGNNGINNLIEHVGEHFARVRIGVANGTLEKVGAVDFVLGHFSTREQQVLPRIAEHVDDFITIFTAESGEFNHTSVQIL